ncbi:MAG: cation transporter [Acidobacteriales bacterium]|nr:cation transporter [Terriglobales bacterium]
MLAPESTVSRLESARAGERLEYFTIAWNTLEGLIAIVAGAVAGSISLVGFGVDSLIEVTSGSALLWRMRAEVKGSTAERVERISLRVVGGCFLALAAYVTYEAAATLIQKQAPERSIVGIVLAAASLIVMPILARAKRRVSAALGSAAMAADARQTDFCTYLSAILLGGLLLNALFGLWWADPVAALVMVPLIVREGIEALQGKTCCA